jgi:hypothetical protein
MTRRILTAALCAALLELTVPTSAHAWWEYIEQLSGPGPFKGWDIQARVLCLVRTPDIDPTTKSQRTDPITKQPMFKTEAMSAPVVGTILSACRIKPDEIRRASVDVGARFLSADGDVRFANGKSIDLTTLESSISYNVFAPYEDSDYLDIAFGAGMYWFASEEFESFRGFFLEPVRIEFHPTTKMKKRTKWTALMPVLRAGYLLFPAGFETAKFNAAAGVPPRISRDWVFNTGIFFDLEGLFR